MLNKDAFGWACGKIASGQVCYKSIKEPRENKNYKHNYICKIVTNADIKDPRDWAYDISSNEDNLSFQKIYSLIALSKEDGEFEVSEACQSLLVKIAKLNTCGC